MNIRTIVYLLIIFLIIGLLITWASYNQHNLTIDFFFGEITASVWVIMLITFLSGFLICLIWMLVRNSQLKFKEWQERKELKKKEEAKVIYLDGVDLFVKGESEKALEKFHQAIQLNNQYVEAYIKAGNILREQKKYEEAIRLHWSARQIQSSNPEALRSLVEDYKLIGDYAKAEDILQKTIELDSGDNISFLRELRKILSLQQQWDEAEKVQLKIIRLAQKGSEKEAEQEVLYGIRYQLGLIELENGNIKEAVSLFRHLIKEKPDFSPAYESLGQIYLKEGKTEKAIDIWLEGFKSSGCHFFLQRIEELYFEQHDPQGAINIYKKALEQAKDDLYLRFLLGKLYYRLEMIDQALNEFKTIEGQVRLSPILNYYIGKSLQKRSEYEKAYESLLKILEEDKEFLEISYFCSNCGNRQSQWQSRCSKCAHWNSFTLDLSHQLEKLKAQPPTFIPTPE